jgi:uncharacterized protein
MIMNRSSILAAIVACAIAGVGLISVGRSAKADNAYHVLTPITPFSQNWSNIALLNAADDWSGVPSINGYSDNVTDNIGGDPQLQLIPSTTIDVSPNQNNPNLFTTGGVAEFDRGTIITDFVVALQGSGTHDFPNIDIRLNTTACTAPNAVRITYNLRDIDGSADNAVQQVALHYRVGSSGNYTNVPGGYVADATTGPSLATLVTPIAVNLPAATRGQPEVHVRIMTTNAPGPGGDEWVGVDEINVTCAAVTAADASISGRIATADGRGIRNVRVVVTGGDLAEPLIALTSPFGYYRIDGLRAGETYFVNVGSKQYVFETPLRVISLGEDALDVDFVGERR